MRPPVPVSRPVSASVTSQSSSPLVWKVGRAGVAEADGEVGDLLAVAEEVLLDQPALEAEAEHEALGPVVAEQLHDVPQDRALADADQRLGDALGLLAQAGAEAAGEDHHRHPLERRVAAAHAGTRRRSASSSSPASTSSWRRGRRWKRGERKSSSVRSLRRVGREDLVDPRLHRPAAASNSAPGLGEVDAVGARVGAGAGGEGHAGAGGLLDHPGDVADLVVVLVAADVEGLVVDGLLRGLERGDEGARDVLDVGERAPRRAVGLHPHLAGRVGVGDEVVDHDVAAHAGRDAVGGGVAEEDGGEAGGRRARRCPARPAPWTRRRA